MPRHARMGSERWGDLILYQGAAGRRSDCSGTGLYCCRFREEQALMRTGKGDGSRMQVSKVTILPSRGTSRQLILLLMEAG
jgi:hypothetical protein